MTAGAFRRFVLIVAAVAWSHAASAATVAVLPLGGGVDAPTRTAWTTALRTAVGTVADDAAVPASSVSDALVTADALGKGCAPVEVGCIARIGALTTADLAVGGRVDASREGVTIVVDLVDVARGRGVRRVVFPTGTVPDDAAARLLAVRLLAPELERAYVTVRGALSGATISIDGEVRATAPLSAPIEVSPGRHEVVVDHIDHDSVARTVDVALGATAVVDVGAAAMTVTRPPTTPNDGGGDGGGYAPAPTRALRVRVAPVARSGGVAESTGRLFAERVVDVLRRVDGVVVLDDTDPATDVAAAMDQLADHALDQQTTVVGDTGPVDLLIEVSIARLGQAVFVVARGTRVDPITTRTYEEAVRGANIDSGLARQAAPLVAAILHDEAVGPVPTIGSDGLSPWVLTATLAAGGVAAVTSGVTGALWLVDGGRSAPLGVACVAGVAATGALAVAAAVEASLVE